MPYRLAPVMLIDWIVMSPTGTVLVVVIAQPSQRMSLLAGTPAPDPSILMRPPAPLSPLITTPEVKMGGRLSFAEMVPVDKTIVEPPGRSVKTILAATPVEVMVPPTI